ncbi:hypothetical protein R6Q59_017986 [Mikania micrantha]
MLTVQPIYAYTLDFFSTSPYLSHRRSCHHHSHQRPLIIFVGSVQSRDAIASSSIEGRHTDQHPHHRSPPSQKAFFRFAFTHFSPDLSFPATQSVNPSVLNKQCFDLSVAATTAMVNCTICCRKNQNPFFFPRLFCNDRKIFRLLPSSVVYPHLSWGFVGFERAS